MTHALIMQGTQSGGPPPRELHLTTVLNESTITDGPSFGTVVLEYVVKRELDLTRVVNAQSFGSVDLQHVIVSLLHQTQVANVNQIGAVSLAAVAFDPVNAETTALISAFDGTYPTTTKRQIDALISALKAAGVWSKLDWYGNAFWATSEHDALLNWANPAQTLVKVGSPTWEPGEGLRGAASSVSNSRYKSGWNVGSGPHSTSTSLAFFCKITAIDVPQNGMQAMGVWRFSSPGPSAPDGSFLNLSITVNSGSSGANVLPFNGNNSFAPGDGLGVWGVSRSGSTNITVKDGVTLESDAVSGVSTYTDADGMSVAGSAGAARRAFPGLQLYWGWGAALTAAELGALETSFQTSLLPPSVGPSGEYYIIDGATGDYWIIDDTTGDYYLVEP